MAAVGLAVIGVVLLLLGLLARPAAPPAPAGQAAAPPTSTTSTTSTRAQPSPEAPRALTTGPLMDSATPVEITIPALAVSSQLVDLGLQNDGAMEVPVNGEDAGWYTGAPTPGALGPAVIAGHVDWKGEPGVFHRLGALRPGDQIEVRREDDSTATFAVTSVQQYPKDAFPTDEVYGAIDHAGLRLITCGGEFDSSRSSYRDNIVAYATLINARP
ncbi:class F sortase [Lentzea xinjiangensis]|uniref:class F sortase n=1 Tax=Lentzea xinjiangensis TaxID=402600 RepID=UPI001FE618E0|nr:class F sortase [Lentzea xinjiangensis]